MNAETSKLVAYEPTDTEIRVHSTPSHRSISFSPQDSNKDAVTEEA